MRAMSRVALPVVLLAAVASAVSGCGGESSDESAIRGVVAKLDAARRSGDAEGACSKLIAVVEPEGERAAKREGEGEGDSDAARSECETAFRRTLTLARTNLRRYSERVEEVEVNGDEAEARARVRAVRSDGSVLVQTVRYRFVDRDGWRLAIDRGG
jgi:hypothetical protein